MIKQIICCALAVLTVSAARAQFVWFDGHHPVTYQVDGPVDPVVRTALQMFSDDMRQVTGMPARPGSHPIIRITQGNDADDGFDISLAADHILVRGHNGRGAAYGLLELSRQAGVSPWVWWGDVVPERRQRLVLPADFHLSHIPSVTYRGIFINDEDWSLRVWSAPRDGRIGPDTYQKIFRLLLRLRANTIWPAMHEGTAGFFTVPGNQAMADSCGIIVGTSHCEPLLRNNVAEWNTRQRGPYDYLSNRRQVLDYWKERLRDVRASDHLFTMGMRGIHDGPMAGVTTIQEQLDGLQRVIHDQRRLIRRYVNHSVSQVPQVFIPYKEVLEVMDAGLQVPDDVTLMWCDDNYGYITRLPDADQQRRSGGSGVYYHLSYWGRPHDYLWLTTTQPGLIYTEMRAAYDHQCRRLWIANVHDPKVAAYDLELFLDMAWDITSVDATTLPLHLQRWLTTQFGAPAAHALLPVMQSYYHQHAIRKPEFMGWTQVELDKTLVRGGVSLVDTVEMNRREALERLDAFDHMQAVVDSCHQLIRPELSDAYFAHVVYPIYASAAMSRKILGDSAESHQAFIDIQRLTATYNALHDGKWRGLMSASPRRLPVFRNVHAHLTDDAPFHGVARHASSFTSYSGTPTSPVVIPMLGHSMQAVSLPRGATLTYTFDAPHTGYAMLYMAMIPTQPSDRGDLRYQVTIDQQPPITVSLKTPFRSEYWKTSVLRGQALKSFPIHLTAGHHTLHITALDDHIIVDQWAIDEAFDRSFYVIPVTP